MTQLLKPNGSYGIEIHLTWNARPVLMSVVSAWSKD